MPGPQRLFVAMPVHAGADHGAIQGVECGEQRGGAVPLVVAGHRARPAPLHGQGRLGASKACAEVFSSMHNTTASSGGFKYKPTTSISFSSNRGSRRSCQGTEQQVGGAVSPGRVESLSPRRFDRLRSALQGRRVRRGAHTRAGQDDRSISWCPRGPNASSRSPSTSSPGCEFTVTKPARLNLARTGAGLRPVSIASPPPSSPARCETRHLA